MPAARRDPRLEQSAYRPQEQQLLEGEFGAASGAGLRNDAAHLGPRADLGLGRLEARTSLGNVASERVLERVGFRREGLARSGFVLPVSREWVDTTMWSLLPGEVAGA